MARTRSVKPDFFTDSVITELSALHRLLFVGLWCHADREGRLEDKPRELKVKVLPFDNCEVDGMLTDLARKGRIVRYEVGGLRLISIPKFKKHQHCHKDEKPSILPPPPEVTTKPAESFETGVAAMAAPHEHRTGTVEAPHEHGANTSGVCNLVSGSGFLVSDSRGTAPPPGKPAPARAVGGLRDGINAIHQKHRGSPLTWNREAEEAVRSLLAHPEVEVLRRWEIALATPFPRCLGLQSLVRHWDTYAAPPPASGTSPPRNTLRRGVARAEDADHSKNRVVDNDGTIEL